MGKTDKKDFNTFSYFLHKLESNVFLYKRILVILALSGIGFLIRNYFFFLFVYDIAVHYFLIYLSAFIVVISTRILLPDIYKKKYYEISNILIILSCAYIFYSLVLISVLDSISIKEFKYVNDHNFTAYIFGLVLIGFTLRISWKISSVIFSGGILLFAVSYYLYTDSVISLQSIFPLLIINILSIYFSFSREKYYKDLYDDKLVFEKLSIRDSLTHLYNRRYLSIVIKDRLALKKRENIPFCCIFTDIDHFKSVNDTYGHDIGDQVLIQFAELLQNESRETDVVTRFGGEEFVIILHNTQLSEAFNIAERIRLTIEKKYMNIITTKITASFGIAEAGYNETEEELLKKADKSLYMAKSNGRNLCCCSEGSTIAH